MTTTNDTTNEPEPGAVVTGPFFSDESLGVGVVVKRGRPIWTRVGEGYVPVRVLKGDRASGGYNPEHLSVIRGLTYNG
jgi:hypothetical protein